MCVIGSTFSSDGLNFESISYFFLKNKIVSFVSLGLYLSVCSSLLYLLDQRGDQPIGLIAVEIVFTPFILMILSGLPLDICSPSRLSEKSG